MKRILFSITLIILLALPVASYAETVQESASTYLEGWYDKSSGIPDVPPPKPTNPSREKSENNNIEIYAEAAAKEKCAHAEKLSGDSCCENTRGDKLGYCPEGYPVYKDIRSETCPNGKCYKNTYDCTRAGIGFCYTCSRCE